ncbi:alpha/beta-hydrolase [Apiospora arundinis]
MSSSKPTIVIVHGGWHVPSSYSKLADLLRSSGLEVHIPRLPSMNETRPPNSDLATDTQLIRSYVESLVEAGRSVIAVLHSYGGQVGSNALVGLGLEARAKAGLEGGVSHLIYMCAFAMPEGGSMVSKVKDFGHKELLPLAFDFDKKNNSVVCRDPKMTLIGDGAGAERVGDSILPRVVGALERDLHCAWREVPVTYVYTSGDMTVPLDYQTSMVEMMKKEGREATTVELSTGHCPNLTKAKEVADVISKVAMSETLDG